MRSSEADGLARLHSWRHVRQFAVPTSMILAATTRRIAGDWAGACAAAHVDVDFDLRTVAVDRGREFAARLQADLRDLAPDLLRWHLPRTIADGLLRPGLTMSLIRYRLPGGDLHLVARTAPTWADFGQRISLALWDPGAGDPGPHPWPRPDHRFRLDLHPHLWSATHAPDLRERSGATPSDPAGPGNRPAGPGEDAFADGSANRDPADGPANRDHPEETAGRQPAEDSTGHAHAEGTADRNPAAGAAETADRDHPEKTAGRDHAAHRHAVEAGPHDAGVEIPAGRGYAVHRWVAEAGILRAADGLRGPVAVRLGGGRRLTVSDDGHGSRFEHHRCGTGGPVLPYAATWLPPDLELLHAGMISPEQLHPLVAAALVPGFTAGAVPPVAVATGVRLVECRGVTHRLGIVDGRLVPLDHHPDELRREELLVTFGGPPLPCLRVIAEDSRSPHWLDEVRTRLDHGDRDGAAALVAEWLGPDAEIEGTLREAFDDADDGSAEHGTYRAGRLAGQTPPRLGAPLGVHQHKLGRRGRHRRLPKRATSRH
ncbi:hypothetical protein [Actinoplanes couchii]|nr:hypothetical protein [Actinoplanes couchii]MDR6321801.1 hypothetical protein [Actinoplanes couchii]